jgi:hypothetical protein
MKYEYEYEINALRVAYIHSRIIVHGNAQSNLHLAAVFGAPKYSPPKDHEGIS